MIGGITNTGKVFRITEAAQAALPSVKSVVVASEVAYEVDYTFLVIAAETKAKTELQKILGKGG
ncbi:MAG: hypothetical protein WA433_01905 [Desulfobaccales bacterium]